MSENHTVNEDFTVRDNDDQDVVIIDSYVNGHAWGVTLPKKSLGKLAEQLHDHINKGGTDNDA